MRINPTVKKRIKKMKALRDIMKASSCESLDNFIHFYLSHLFSIPKCTFHNELIQDLSSIKTNKRMARVAPRGHGKSTIAALAYPLWCVCTKRKEFILLIGSNDTMAKEKMQDLISEIENNDQLIQDFPHLKPAKDFKKQYVKYTDSQVIFTSGATIVAKGMNVSMRGMKKGSKRPDLIILDDMDKDNDLSTPSIRERNKKTFDNVIKNLGGPEQTLDIIAIDTLKHYDSLIEYIMNKPGWDCKKYSAVLDDSNRIVLWDSRYVYSVDDLTDWEKANYDKKGAKGFEKIREPLYGMWFEHESDEYPKIVGKSEDNPDSFNQEFLGQPMLLDQMPLRKEFWQYFDYPSNLDFRMRVGALDLSMGTKSGDYQAVCAVGGLHNDYYLLDASLSKFDLMKQDENQDSLATLCMLMIQRYELKLFIVEDNGAQGLFIHTLRKKLKEQNILCRIVGKKSTGNKHERITGNLGLVMQRGSFYIRRDWSKIYFEFMKQFEYFPKADHDDAPDVTNMAVMAIQKSKSNQVSYL